ncbi:hypothetical protein Tco_0275838 [Tanacetum coccineum]
MSRVTTDHPPHRALESSSTLDRSSSCSRHNLTQVNKSLLWDDDDVMFIGIVKKNDNSFKEEPEVEGLEVEYFDVFPTRSELAYHKYLMCGPIPSIFLRNPIIMEGCPSNLKIPCNIGHVHVEKAYIDLEYPTKIKPEMNVYLDHRRNRPLGNSNRRLAISQ